MNAICIIGSPRANGNTSIIVDKVIEGMKENSIEVTKFCLGDMNIKYCLGCKDCFNDGKCVQKDDMDLLMEKLIESDIVLIASPSYWGDVTGNLKVFFDRNTPFSETNEKRTLIPPGKKGISIAIRAGQTTRENIHIIESIEHYFGHLGIQPIGKLTIEGIDHKADLMKRPELFDKAYELGCSVKK